MIRVNIKMRRDNYAQTKMEMTVKGLYAPSIECALYYGPSMTSSPSLWVVETVTDFYNDCIYWKRENETT